MTVLAADIYPDFDIQCPHRDGQTLQLSPKRLSDCGEKQTITYHRCRKSGPQLVQIEPVDLRRAREEPDPTNLNGQSNLKSAVGLPINNEAFSRNCFQDLG